MKKWCLGFLLVIALSNFVVGCGSDSKWKPYLGMWTNKERVLYQMEIKANGDSFILTQFSKSFFGKGMDKESTAAKPSGEVLVISLLGDELPIEYDKKTDTISFNNNVFRRQTPEDAKKLEELKNSK